MSTWLSSAIRDRLFEVALAVGLGSALAGVADRLAEAPVSVLAQHVGGALGENDTVFCATSLLYAPYYLNFRIGGTVIVYGRALTAVVALALVALVALFVVSRRDRVLGLCPYCESRIPYASTHCAYCGSSVSPGEPSLPAKQGF